jgi:hypothetical protein
VLLGAAAVAGLVTATAVPDDRAGLGWFAAAVALAVAVALVRRVAVPEPDSGRPHRRLSPDTAWTLAALALMAVVPLRAAEWLAALCVLAAAVAAALAVAGPSFRSVPAGLLGVAAAMLRSVPWIVRGGRGAGVSSRWRTAAAALLGVAALAVFGSLLASADPAFARVLDDLLPTVEGDSSIRWVFLFGFGATAVSGACFLRLAPPEPKPARPRTTGLRCLEWALPTGLLVALFAAFVGVQFATLFGGDAYVRSTTGLTYAEYARGGFWQLLAVTVLTLGVLALGSRWAPDGTAVEQAWKRGLLGSLAGLTLVIVASAINRMWLYQQAYGFTVLRLLVLTGELWLGVGFLIVLAAVLQLRILRLTRPMIAAGVLALLGLAVLNPERFVAEHNVARLADTGQLDIYYLTGLSADAVPALFDLPEPARSCALASIKETLAGPDDWRSRNLAREVARTTLADLHPSWPGPMPPGRCAEPGRAGFR